MRVAGFNSNVTGARGFTLVELVVVLVVMGILAVVALPRLMNFTMYEVAYRDQVKTAIEQARKSAVARRRHTCLQIDASTVTLSAELVEPQNHAGGCPYTALNFPGSDTNTMSASSGVTISPTLTVMFDAEGRTATATTVFTVTDAGGSAVNFTLESGSGYVHD